ncbi:MAG: fumarate reductase cytochrome b subunit [Gammaproteobacteria bacterium]|nr:fumarate reductase cytochrome b subunit [Gammaproteobacteria bacterium]
MKDNKALTVDVGLDQLGGKSRLPARLDLAQSLSGLLLMLFMLGHMFFVSSILFGKDAMYMVTRTFEGYYLFGKSYPWLVSLAVACILILFVLHAGLAMRKFPASYQQYKVFLAHKSVMKHSDTSLWLMQVYTGFLMLFLGSAHLFEMFFHPEKIGPYASADRLWSDGHWPFSLILAIAVVLHGSIGLYRLALKWGWLQGADPEAGRRRLKVAMWLIIGFFLMLEMATLAAYMRIGIEHQDNAGERYHSVSEVEASPPASTVEMGLPS